MSGDGGGISLETVHHLLVGLVESSPETSIPAIWGTGMGLIDTIRQELPVIRQAPFSIGFSVLILTGTAIAAIYFGILQEPASRKDDLIRTLKDQLEVCRSMTKETPTPTPPSRSTGNATSSGNDSPANTGDNNKFERK